MPGPALRGWLGRAINNKKVNRVHGVSPLKSCASGFAPCVRYRLRNLLLLVLSFCAIQSGITYADGLQTFIQYLFEGLSTVYSVILYISVFVAVLVLATSMIAIFTGGKTAFEKIYNIILYAILALFFIWLAPVIVKAAHEPLIGYVQKFNATEYDDFAAVPHLADALQSIWDTAELIISPLCVMGIVYGAWTFFSINILGRISTARQIEQGKAMIKYAIIALVVFYLLPIVLKSGYAAFHSVGWNPPEAKTIPATTANPAE